MPKLEPWDDRDAKCDHCGAAASQWPSGLATIDRERGGFTSSFTTCPDCIPDVHFGLPRPADGIYSSTILMIRGCVEFTFIKWYWWPGRRWNDTPR